MTFDQRATSDFIWALNSSGVFTTGSRPRKQPQPVGAAQKGNPWRPRQRALAAHASRRHHHHAQSRGSAGESDVVIDAAADTPRRECGLSHDHAQYDVALQREDWSLKALPIDLGIRARNVSIISLKHRTLSPVAERFIEHARAAAKSLKQA
jgi:hypothetical protein